MKHFEMNIETCLGCPHCEDDLDEEACPTGHYSCSHSDVPEHVSGGLGSKKKDFETIPEWCPLPDEDSDSMSHTSGMKEVIEDLIGALLAYDGLATDPTCAEGWSDEIAYKSYMDATDLLDKIAKAEKDGG